MFSLEVEKSWGPWAFAKATGDRNKVIAALELLATLVGVCLWVRHPRLSAYTDNQSNEVMTTKFPSILM